MFGSLAHRHRAPGSECRKDMRSRLLVWCPCPRGRVDSSAAATETEARYRPPALYHQQQRCRYLQQDLRRADFGQGYDLIMLIYGELNTFRPNDAKRILQKAQQSLAPNGQLVLEVHTFAAVQAMGKRPPTWVAPVSGLFSSQPHLRLSEDFWDATQNAATRRYIVIDAASGQATRYAASMQAYTRADYHGLLTACGFTDIVFHLALSDRAALVDGDYEVIVCRV